MSKIKGKDLTYDASQPAFLQRLRGQIAGGDSARHEIAIPRNRRLKHQDEEDAPTYVLEDTNQSLTKAEYEALVAGKDGEPDPDAEPPVDERKDKGPGLTKDNIAEVGKGTKKRKAVKIIGDQAAEAGEDSNTELRTTKNPKKKAKKVKLSFGDQEEG